MSSRAVTRRNPLLCRDEGAHSTLQSRSPVSSWSNVAFVSLQRHRDEDQDAPQRISWCDRATRCNRGIPPSPCIMIDSHHRIYVMWGLQHVVAYLCPYVVRKHDCTHISTNEEWGRRPPLPTWFISVMWALQSRVPTGHSKPHLTNLAQTASPHKTVCSENLTPDLDHSTSSTRHHGRDVHSAVERCIAHDGSAGGRFGASCCGSSFSTG